MRADVGELDVSDFTGHTSFHVINIVAMKEPAPGIVRNEIELGPTHVCSHQYRVLQGVADPEEMPVQMHGMQHHAMISHTESYSFTCANCDWIRVGVSLPVDGPGGTHHPSS